MWPRSLFARLTVDIFCFKLNKFGLEDKVKLVTGLGYQGGPCSANTPAVLSFSGLCIQESALGVGSTDFVTAFPAGINVAAT